MLRILAIPCLLLAIFAADDLSLRFRIPNNREPFGTVKVKQYMAIPQKGGKFQFVFQGMEERQCVNALFPHMGSQPCWYLEKHQTERNDM